MLSSKPESVQELINRIDAETYGKLKDAVEIGKWESGQKLSEAQLEYCLQAIIAYDNLHLEPPHRVGFIDRSKLDDRNMASRLDISYAETDK